MDKQLTGKKPGLLWVNSKLTKPDQVNPGEYKKWYEQVHIPDIFKTSGMKEAYRYQSINPEDQVPYLALYPLKDTDFLETDEFKGTPFSDTGGPLLTMLTQRSRYMTMLFRALTRYSILPNSTLGTTSRSSCMSLSLQSQVRSL